MKRIIGFMIFHDGACRGLEPNGVIEDLQTFWDPMWYGPNPYNNTLYLAALRAAEEMARLMGQDDLAERYHAIYERGRSWMNERMWNGEYYVHLYPKGFQSVQTDNGTVSPEDERSNAKGYIDAFECGEVGYFSSSACDAQQLFGQNWAHQLDLGYILPTVNCRKAAKSIFRYNWAPDISTVYDLYPPLHRTLAAPGEAALVSASWPRVERQEFENIHDKDDVWTGLEYQSACDMINEGLFEEGIIVLRAIHDRYDARKRNPWNEIEGAEHSGRSMHSWNVLLALSGYTYDGPAGRIGFAPRVTPNAFECFFSAAEGWGRFIQRMEEDKLEAVIEVRWGTLRLKEISLADTRGDAAIETHVSWNGRRVSSRVESQDGRVVFHLSEETTIFAGDRLTIRCG